MDIALARYSSGYFCLRNKGCLCHPTEFDCIVAQRLLFANRCTGMGVLWLWYISCTGCYREPEPFVLSDWSVNIWTHIKRSLYRSEKQSWKWWE